MDEIERIKQLREILTKSSYEYYVLDKPTILDSEYDQLFRELEELEANIQKLMIQPHLPRGLALKFFQLSKK